MNFAFSAFIIYSSCCLSLLEINVSVVISLSCSLVKLMQIVGQKLGVLRVRKASSFNHQHQQCLKELRQLQILIIPGKLFFYFQLQWSEVFSEVEQRNYSFKNLYFYAQVYEQFLYLTCPLKQELKFFKLKAQTDRQCTSLFHFVQIFKLKFLWGSYL